MRNNISFFLALSFLAFSSISFAQVSEEVKKNIKERVETGNNVSITVGFIDGEKVDFFSYGKTSLENGTLVNENSVYEIGSISKVFTTILLADEVLKGTTVSYTHLTLPTKA